jgi:hypothetical protein
MCKVHLSYYLKWQRGNNLRPLIAFEMKHTKL